MGKWQTVLVLLIVLFLQFSHPVKKATVLFIKCYCPLRPGKLFPKESGGNN